MLTFFSKITISEKVFHQFTTGWRPFFHFGGHMSVDIQCNISLYIKLNLNGNPKQKCVKGDY
ncbi:hypothetical protein A6K24_24960 [Metabacillus litoralis]|uniref:Uncharacterized protein n=1 Tax=Metabacillus litoralis TaxID=152268 RepID=A0A179SSF1_9BACI|nr:hypothetical protein A6K24_24960 [Metabacillus litoralis]